MKTFMIPALANVLKSSAGMAVNQIALANESTFNTTFLSETLTAYAVGYPGQLEQLRQELNALAPAVPTARRFEYRVADNADAFATETDDSDIRQIGAMFKTVTVKGEIVQAKTYSKGLTVRLDREQIDADPMAKEKAVNALKERLLRAEIFRAALLLGAANTVNKNWASGAIDTDPDSDLPDALKTSAEKSGIYDNRIVFGPGAWIKRVTGLRKMITAGGFASGGFSEAELAAYLGVDLVYRARSIRTVTKDDKVSIVGLNKVLCFYAQDNMSARDPSNIKRFTSDAEWTVYEQDVAAELVDITVAHRSLIALTSNKGIVSIDVA